MTPEGMPKTREDIRPRAGLESSPIERAGKDVLYGTYLFENMDGLQHIYKALDSSKSDDEVKSDVVDFLDDYCGLASGETDREKLRRYERYAHNIGRAQTGLQGNVERLHVKDMYQRMGNQLEIATTVDPVEQLDMLRTMKDARARFEIRQLLHTGAMLYEYEQTFGTQGELQQALHDFLIFIDGLLFPILHLEDGTFYHKVAKNKEGGISAIDIRSPRHEKKPTRLSREENFVPVTYRTCPFPNGDNVRVLLLGRPKDPYSAFLKSVEKGTSISGIRDVLGMTFFVDHRTSELHTFIKRLLHFFERSGITISEHERHLLRRDPNDPVVKDTNKGRSSKFGMEKLVIDWHPSFSVACQSEIDPVLARLYSSDRNKRKFWKRATEKQSNDIYIPIEIQIGTLKDMANLNIEGDSLHVDYKFGKASTSFEGTPGLNLLEAERPKRFYKIDLVNKGPALDAMIAKQNASIGLHRKALEAADDAANATPKDKK